MTGLGSSRHFIEMHQWSSKRVSETYPFEQGSAQSPAAPVEQVSAVSFCRVTTPLSRGLGTRRLVCAAREWAGSYLPNLDFLVDLVLKIFEYALIDHCVGVG